MSLTLQILPRLISSVDHSVAMGILHHQKVAFMQLSQDVSAAPAAYGGIKHIDYLIAHWMPVPMWKVGLNGAGWLHQPSLIYPLRVSSQ